MTRPTAGQIQMLKHKLLGQRKALLASAREELARWAEHPMGEVAGEVPDAGDDSFAVLTTDLDHSLLQRHVDAIRDIDAALSRVHARQFAICIDCGDDIQFERLSAFPTAKRCLACQSRRERTFAQNAMPTL